MVSTKPWSAYTAADYTPQQYKAACLVDTGEGDPLSKGRYKLPVRTPGGALNVNGVMAAGASLAGSRGGVNISQDLKVSAAKKLIPLYKKVGKEPPDSVLKLAGRSQSSAQKIADAVNSR